MKSSSPLFSAGSFGCCTGRKPTAQNCVAAVVACSGDQDRITRPDKRGTSTAETLFAEDLPNLRILHVACHHDWGQLVFLDSFEELLDDRLSEGKTLPAERRGLVRSERDRHGCRKCMPFVERRRVQHAPERDRRARADASVLLLPRKAVDYERQAGEVHGVRATRALIGCNAFGF